MRNQVFHASTATVLPSFLVTLLLVAALAPPSIARQNDDRRTIRVSGEGMIETPPDMASVRFAVVTVADVPDAARSGNGRASARTMNAVRSLGIDESDIQMRTLRLQPKQEWNPDRRTYEQKGFEATRSVQVTVRDLDLLPELVASVVDEGANRLEGISYELDARKPLEREALRMAVVDAREKAAEMASAAGAEIARVITISEQSVPRPQPVTRNFEVMSAKAEGAPEPDAFAGGLIEIRAFVSVVFELE